jgi:hypothetical protein
MASISRRRRVGRERVLDAGHVERRPPAALVVLRELEVVALAVHADGDGADAAPGVEVGAEGVESAVIREHGQGGESDCRLKELAALVEHGLFDQLVRSHQYQWRNRQP